MMMELERASRLRRDMPELKHSETHRVFHGPGEGTGTLQSITIDRYGPYAWITAKSEIDRATKLLLIDFLQAEFKGAVVMNRETHGSLEMPTLLFGEVPQERFWVKEGALSFSIQLLDTRHPGLFLDLADVRAGLVASQKDKSVLNCFSYTGSLSSAAFAGGAKKVVSIDLSAKTLDWAKTNLEKNRVHADQTHSEWNDDVMSLLPRWARRGDRFDTVISDPPSFSRSKKGTFSTQKDLDTLHGILIDMLAPGGTLISVINSEKVSVKAFQASFENAADLRSRYFTTVSEIRLPPTFPLHSDDFSEGYLKGLIVEELAGPTLPKV
jgi:23S rRNA (cytosine1962-C5)-methyltransferase